MSKFFLFHILLLLICWSSLVDELEAKTTFKIPEPVSAIEFYADTSRLSFEQIGHLADVHFKPYSGQTLLRYHTYWFRFLVKKDLPLNETYLMHFNSFITNITLFQPLDSGRFQQFTSGSLVPESKRSKSGYLKDKVPFTITRAALDGHAYYYMKVRTTLEHAYTLSRMEVVRQSVFDTSVRKINCEECLFLGMLIIIFILNSTLYGLTRDRLYLFYLFYVVCVCLYFTSYYQYTEVLFLKNHPRADLELNTILTLAPLAYTWFFIEALKHETRKRTKLMLGLRRYALTISALALILIIISFFDYHRYIMLNDYFLLLNALFVIGIFLFFYRKASPMLKIIQIGSLFMVLGGAFSTITNFSKIAASHIDLYQVGVFIELICFTIAINFIYNNDRLAKLKLQLKNSELLSEQLIKEKEAAELKEILAEKNRALTSKAMMIAQKEKMIGEVIEELSGQGVAELPYSSIRKAVLHLKSGIQKDSWKEFELLFQEVHPHFYDALMQKYPNLTTTDKKICAFIKLNLNTKEICEITGRNANTIDVARYRLRKKMGLGANENLTSVISGIG